MVPGESAYIAKTRTKNVRQVKSATLVAYGVGITECVLTATNLLNDGAHVTLIVSNRTIHDVLFRDQILSLCRQFADAFRLVFLFSRHLDNVPIASELSIASLRLGRFDSDCAIKLLADGVIDPESSFMIIGSREQSRSGIRAVTEALGRSPLFLLF